MITNMFSERAQLNYSTLFDPVLPRAQFTSCHS